MIDVINNIDSIVYSFLISFRSETLDNIMLVITNMASAVVLIGLAIVLWIVLKNKIYALNLTIVFIINRILKLIFSRERPQDVVHIIEESGFSFPSAHSMIGAAFYGYIIYMLYKSNNKHKISYICLLTILILLIGLSRIYLGAHYFTDVIGGIIFAIIYLIFFILLEKRRK